MSQAFSPSTFRPRSPWAAAVILLALISTTLPTLAAGHDPLEPASSGGLEAIDQALAKLSAHRRLLVLATHPDDEDTRLLTYVARGLGGEAAYLSLSRGEGGQNLIGPELGLGLGLLRSRELLAARSIDGARQYFTRAYDFGYTRSLDETLTLWPEEVLLEDALRVARRFKPQVLLAVFPPSARAGHGQHWASGMVAEKVYALADDPSAAADLAEEGLHPWSIETFYRSTFFDRESTTLTIPLGALEPFSGRSLFQISLASRSRHRCQDMGLELPLGDAEGRLAWVEGGAGKEGTDLFAGVDTRLEAMAEPLPEGDLKRTVQDPLRRAGELAAATRRELTAVDPGRATAPLLEIVGALRAAHDALSAEDPVERQVRELVEEKLEIAEEAAAASAGVVADAITDREIALAGGRLETRSIFWNAGSHTAGDLRVEVVSPDGWREVGRRAPEDAPSFFATRVTDEQILDIEIPANAEPTIPYFLARPLDGALYAWDEVPAAWRGEPFQPTPLMLHFHFTLDGTPITLKREVVERSRDQAYGEVRRPLRTAARLEVAVEPELLVWTLGDRRTATLDVAVTSNDEAALEALVELEAPPGWEKPESRTVRLDPHGRAVAHFELAAPENLAPGREIVRASARVGGETQRFAASYPLVDYEHIRPTPRPVPATTELRIAEIRRPELGRIAYVRGAADRIPEFLRRIGYQVDVLDGDALRGGDLSIYKVLVVGPRAYETDRALLDANPRLLEWAKAGGTLLVQYQQYQFVQGGYAAFPLEIGRPHGRVTDETAAVQTLTDHAVLHRPNVLGEADWQGWVQERGLYFAETWDAAYTPILAMADPEREEEYGALLVAPLGEGYYIYTGLAFFRQLPAGVPGAYRLFINLLALGSEDAS